MSVDTKVSKDGPLPIDDAALAMPPEDMVFLVDCLKNPVGGGVVCIDAKAVAEARGYKNAGSVTNRIGRLRKRYNLPITASLSGPRKMEFSPGDESAPVTPVKSKVAKARAPRGRPPKTPKKVTQSDSASSEDGKGKVVALPKKVRKFATAGGLGSGNGETGVRTYKVVKSAHAEEDKVLDDVTEAEDDTAEAEEEKGCMETPEILEVEERQSSNEA